MEILDLKKKKRPTVGAFQARLFANNGGYQRRILQRLEITTRMSLMAFLDPLQKPVGSYMTWAPLSP